MFFWSTTTYSSTYYETELWNILHAATLIANIHILNKQKTQFPGAGTIPSFGGCELVLAAEVAQNIGMKEKPLVPDSGSPLEHSQYWHWETGTTGGNLNRIQPPRCLDKLCPAASVPVPAWWPQNQLQQQLHFASLCATSTSNAGATSTRSDVGHGKHKLWGADLFKKTTALVSERFPREMAWLETKTVSFPWLH